MSQPTTRASRTPLSSTHDLKKQFTEIFALPSLRITSGFFIEAIEDNVRQQRVCSQRSAQLKDDAGMCLRKLTTKSFQVARNVISG